MEMREKIKLKSKKRKLNNQKLNKTMKIILKQQILFMIKKFQKK
jgi:hypothetical protein